jgi:hypothetical protein
MDKKLQMVAGLHQCMEAVRSALELRQNAQMTNGVIDRALCDNVIAQSASIIKEIVSELNKG